MDQSIVGLNAAVRALTDVVAPAVDNEHAQAADQLRLVSDYLSFLAERLDDLSLRHRFELAHHVKMAGMVEAVLVVRSEALASARHAAQGLLARADATPRALRQADGSLSAAISAVVRQASSSESGERQAIERCVLQWSHERIAFERSWYLPLKLDPDPHEVRPLTDFLGPR